tara:strand:+ start:1271 stop:2668 length:1398 start_codon:yes stop_codon:yes gene_type:complete
MIIRYYSHATFQLVSEKGLRLLTDPWLFNPVYGHMIWQFPECPISDKEYFEQDFIYISHEHPDHFCLRTLDSFSRHTPIIIRRYNTAEFLRNRLHRLGFLNTIELSHRESICLGKDLEVTLVADPFSSDSLLIVSDGSHTVLNQNDCIPTVDDQAWIDKNFDIDLGLIFYSGGSQYPSCFEMDDAAKKIATEKRINSQMLSAIDITERMGIRRAIPAANDMCSFRNPEFDQFASALPVEFRDFVRLNNVDLEILLVSPGETYSFVESSDNFNKFFKNRDEWIKEADKLRNHRDVVETKEKLERFERKALFDHQKFQMMMAQYLSVCPQRMVTSILVNNNFKVGFIINQGDRRHGYLISCDVEGVWNIVPGVAMSILECEDLHMCVSVNADVAALAMSGALTWEDLMNGQYRVYRPVHSFNDNEYAFWEMLSGFTPYLEEKNEQPECGLRGKFQIKRDTSNMSLGR